MAVPVVSAVVAPFSMMITVLVAMPVTWVSVRRYRCTETTRQHGNRK